MPIGRTLLMSVMRIQTLNILDVIGCYLTASFMSIQHLVLVRSGFFYQRCMAVLLMNNYHLCARKFPSVSSVQHSPWQRGIVIVTFASLSHSRRYCFTCTRIGSRIWSRAEAQTFCKCFTGASSAVARSTISAST